MREKRVLPLVRRENFVHAFAEMGTALFEFVDAPAILAAAEVIGDADDQHDTANEREEVSEGEGDRKVPRFHLVRYYVAHRFMWS